MFFYGNNSYIKYPYVQTTKLNSIKNSNVNCHSVVVS